MILLLQAPKLRFLLRKLFILGLLFYTAHSHAQNPLDVLLKEGADFPYGWVGIWKGELEIHKAEGLQQSLPMQLHILPTDTTGRYSWLIIYGPDDPANRRNYLLETIDKDNGHYQIDEQNSIALDAYFINNKLFSRFSVMGNLLLSSYELQNDELVFEIVSGSLTPASQTGDVTVDGNEIPPVDAFPVGVVQRAVLRRE